MKNEKTNSKILRSKYVPSSEFYSQIIDSLQDYSILTLDKDLKINSWSAGSVAIFGYDTEEVIGEDFSLIFTEEDIKSEIPKFEIKTAIENGRAVDNRWHVCKDGSKFYAYGLVFPLTGTEGELLGYVKILRDLTERKKSDDAIKIYIKELEELNTHKESILAILSHDLRSPLSGIIGATKYMKENLDKMDRKEIKEMLELVHKSTEDELNMLDYLVEWARIKYASEVFLPADVAITEFVNKVFDSLSESASNQNIKLLNEIKVNAQVFADEKMLFSILQNITSNAIKHSKSGDKIVVSAKKKGEMLVVEVKDTGLGMAKNIQEKLFIPQIDSLSIVRAKDKGAGIGLLLVKGFLEKNGGDIWVKSSEGVGTSFFFSLPIKKQVEKIDSVEKVEFDEIA